MPYELWVVVEARIGTTERGGITDALDINALLSKETETYFFSSASEDDDDSDVQISNIINGSRDPVWCETEANRFEKMKKRFSPEYCLVKRCEDHEITHCWNLWVHNELMPEKQNFGSVTMTVRSFEDSYLEDWLHIDGFLGSWRQKGSGHQGIRAFDLGGIR